MNTEITKLVSYIEENLRASTTAGLSFVDVRQFRNRLFSKQNHVVFGRRGAGKTSLVKSIQQRTNEHIDIYLNLEDYKDITFPNILIHILLVLFSALDNEIRAQSRVWMFCPTYLKATRRLGRLKRKLEVS